MIESGFFERIDRVSEMVTVPELKKALMDLKAKCLAAGKVTNDDSHVLLDVINVELKLARYREENINAAIDPLIEYMGSIIKIVAKKK